MSPIGPGFQFWQLPILAILAILAIFVALCLRPSAKTSHPTPHFSTLVANKRLSPIDACVALAWPLGDAWVAQGPPNPNPSPKPNRQRVANAAVLAEC